MRGRELKRGRERIRAKKTERFDVSGVKRRGRRWRAYPLATGSHYLSLSLSFTPLSLSFSLFFSACVAANVSLSVARRPIKTPGRTRKSGVAVTPVKWPAIDRLRRRVRRPHRVQYPSVSPTTCLRVPSPARACAEPFVSRLRYSRHHLRLRYRCRYPSARCYYTTIPAKRLRYNIFA